VLDLEGRAQALVPGTLGALAVGVAPELGIGFSCQGRSSTVSVFNLATLMVEKELRTTGGGPGGILFDPATRRIFTFNVRGRNATAFDAFGGAVAGSIPLGGEPGPALTDGTGTLYASVGGAGELMVLSARKLAVLQRWTLPQLARPVGLALDAGRKRLFILGADGQLGMVDTDTGRMLSSLPTGSGGAGLACDPAEGRVYVAREGGGVAVVEARDGATLTAEATLATPPGAWALVLDPEAHLLYLPIPVNGGESPANPSIQVHVFNRKGT
jgi:DNA-binding beta-propeller fold protein YncE